MHVPQWSVSCVVSWTNSASVSNAARKSQLPIWRLSSKVFLPIQPSPASWARSRSMSGAVSTTPRNHSRHLGAQKIGQFVQPSANERVIIVAPGVARDPALARVGACRLGRAVIHRQHDDAAHSVEDRARMLIRRLPIGEVVHLPGISLRQPIVEPGNSRRRNGRTDASQLEPQRRASAFRSLDNVATSVMGRILANSNSKTSSLQTARREPAFAIRGGPSAREKQPKRGLFASGTALAQGFRPSKKLIHPKGVTDMNYEPVLAIAIVCLVMAATLVFESCDKVLRRGRTIPMQRGKAKVLGA